MEMASTSMIILPMLILMGLAVTTAVAQGLPVDKCHEGSFVEKILEDGYAVCESCPLGKYMPYTIHTHKQCFNCSRLVDPAKEIMLHPCNRTHDAVIIDTTGELKQPLICNRGEHINSTSGLCVPCPADTYQPHDNHTNLDCHRCVYPTVPNSHVVVLQKCNSTHPPVFGCEEGYYLEDQRHGDGPRCSICKNCTVLGEFEGRPCNQRDTVCCPKANMIVVESLGRPECRESPASPVPTDVTLAPEVVSVHKCGQDEYVHINSINDTEICRPCPELTFRNESNHTYLSCQNCSEIESRHHDLPPKCISASQKSSGMSPVILGTIVIIILLCILGAIIVVVCVRKKKHNSNNERQANVVDNSDTDIEMLDKTGQAEQPVIRNGESVHNQGAEPQKNGCKLHSENELEAEENDPLIEDPSQNTQDENIANGAPLADLSNV